MTQTNASPQTFIGRDEVLGILNKRVDALQHGYRQNIALTGQKLCGKTTILQHFLSTLEGPSFLPIYIEVLPEPFTNFARKFVGTTLFKLLSLSGKEVVEDLGSLLIKGGEVIPKTTAAVREILRLLDKRHHDEAYSLLFDLTSVIKDETRRSCIIILDEFHNLAYLELKKPFVAFGKKIMIQKDTMYIVTSSQVTSIKRILREKLSLLFGNFETIEVTDFDYEKSCEFLRHKLSDVRINPELRDFLIDFTNGRPFYLDIIISRLKDIVSGLQFKWINQSVISQVFQDLFFDPKGTLNQYFQNLLGIFLDRSHTASYLDILIAISEGKNSLKDIESGFPGKKGSVRSRIEELIEGSIITKNGTKFYYSDKVLDFWVRFVYSRKKYSLITSMLDSSNLFKKDVEDLMSGFIAISKMNIYDRLKDLISSFGNEIVTIGEKRVRMPSFKSIDMKIFREEDFYINAWYDAGKSWIFQFSFSDLDDSMLAFYINRFRDINPKARCKILISLAGMDENSMLIAKQNRVWVWDKKMLNNVLSLYKKCKVLT